MDQITADVVAWTLIALICAGLLWELSIRAEDDDRWRR